MNVRTGHQNQIAQTFLPNIVGLVLSQNTNTITGFFLSIIISNVDIKTKWVKTNMKNN